MLPAPGSGATGDIRLAMLANEHCRVNEDLTRLTIEAERRHGLFAYNGPPYKDRYDALLDSEDRLVTLLAQARPDGLRGLVLKVRAAFYGEDIGENLDCDPRILSAALRDLEYFADNAPPTAAWSFSSLKRIGSSPLTGGCQT